MGEGENVDREMKGARSQEIKDEKGGRLGGVAERGRVSEFLNQAGVRGDSIRLSESET